MLETESFTLDDKEDFLKMLAEAQQESRSVSRKTSRMMSPAPISHICDEDCSDYQGKGLFKNFHITTFYLIMCCNQGFI